MKRNNKVLRTNTKVWLPGWFGVFLLAGFLFIQGAGAQGLSFPSLQTDQKQKIGLEETGIEISGWSNISGYNDDEFLPYINKHQNYSGEYFQGQAREIFLKLTEGSKNPYATLVRELAKASWKRRAEALAGLGYMGEGAVEAIPLIIPALQDTRRLVRLNALWALVKIDPKNPLVARAAFEFFSARLEDHPRMAFWALAATGNRSEEVIDLVVLKTIKNANLILQDALVFLRKSDYIPTRLLRENLTHFDLQNRYNTVLMVAGWPEVERTRFIPELILLVNDVNQSIRVAASYTLGLIGRPAQRAAPFLRIAADLGEGEVSDISAWALRRIAPIESD